MSSPLNRPVDIYLILWGITQAWSPLVISFSLNSASTDYKFFIWHFNAYFTLDRNRFSGAGKMAQEVKCLQPSLAIWVQSQDLYGVWENGNPLTSTHVLWHPHPYKIIFFLEKKKDFARNGSYHNQDCCVVGFCRKGFAHYSEWDIIQPIARGQLTSTFCRAPLALAWELISVSSRQSCKPLLGR